MITNYDNMQMQMKDSYEGHIRGQHKRNAHFSFLKKLFYWLKAKHVEKKSRHFHERNVISIGPFFSSPFV